MKRNKQMRLISVPIILVITCNIFISIGTAHFKTALILNLSSSDIDKTNIFDRTHPLSPKISILVNSTIYHELQSSLDQYKSDIESLGYITEIRNDAWSNHEDIRAYLYDEWSHNALVGCLIVGNLPYAMYEMGSDIFPIDLYYTDLDGIWIDVNNNGLYEHHGEGKGDKEPEIWLGRVTISSEWDDEISLIKNYFRKIHDYREGNLSQPDRALLYVDDDGQDSTDEWDNDLSLLYQNRTVENDFVTTNATDYKERLIQGYEWIQVHCHANHSAKRHSFKIHDGIDNDGDNQTDEDDECFRAGGVVNSSDIRTIDPHALFYNIFTCTSADYTVPDYLCGWYILTGVYGIACIGSTKSGAMLHFSDFYRPLSEGKCLGESFKEWFIIWGEDSPSWFYGMTIIGDPVLSPLTIDSEPPAPPRNLGAKIDGKDIFLNWTEPVTNDIGHYLIYRARTINEFNFSNPYHNTSTGVNPLATNWTDIGAGDENLNDYFYVVRAVDNAGNEEKNTNKVAKFVKILSSGQQLISIPLIQLEENLTKILQTIEGNYSYVQWYDPLDTTDHWKTHSINKPTIFNDLHNANHKKALWITMTSPDNLIVAGKVPKSTNIQLYKGWNFVSYPSFMNRSVSEALQGIPYEQVEGFDENSSPYYLRIMKDEDVMTCGYGYWVGVAEDCMWTVHN